MIRKLLYYAIFLAVSGAVHYWLFMRDCALPEAELEGLGFLGTPLEIMPRIVPPRADAAPVPIPEAPPEQEIEEEPVSEEPEEEVIVYREPEALPLPEEAPPAPEAPAEKHDPEPVETLPDEPEPEPEKALPAELEPEPRKTQVPPAFAEQDDPDLPAVPSTAQEGRAAELEESPAVHSVAAAPSPLLSSPPMIMTIESYRSFLRTEMVDSPEEGVEVPSIAFTGRHTREMHLDLIRFYGIELIVYNRDRSKLILVDLDEYRFSLQKDEQILRDGRHFSNRGFVWSTELTQEIGRDVARSFGIPENEITIHHRLPQRIARYFAWKEYRIAQEAGAPIADVDHFIASFRMTQFGGWFLHVQKIVLRDRTVIPVQDFEVSRVRLLAE